MENQPTQILLVEDNPHDLELALHALKKNNISNQIHIARDGVEALDFIFCRGIYADRHLSTYPKVILLDLKLPKVDGLEVLRRIRGDERTKRLPVVIVTSSKQDKDLLDGYELGANSYVRKPIDFQEFAEAIKQLGNYWLQVNESPSRGG